VSPEEWDRMGREGKERSQREADRNRDKQRDGNETEFYEDK
jgi:hypothetical protein